MDLQGRFVDEIIKSALNHMVQVFLTVIKVQSLLVVVVAKVKELLKVKKWRDIEDMKL
jgi:hypothetical protein